MAYYEEALAAAYVRGTMYNELPSDFAEKPLEDLTPVDKEKLFQLGKEHGLLLYHFKKKNLLPRIQVVLGILKNIYPQTLLDIGTGRGVFMVPFLTKFPGVQVTALDILPKRAAMWQAVNRGGFDNLAILQEDICTWQGASNSFDVVTLLEVLEHIPQVELAIKNAVRLTKKYVIVSVPSQPDDNPEHIHLLTRPILTDLFAQTGCTKIRFQEVHEHLIAMVEKEQV